MATVAHCCDLIRDWTRNRRGTRKLFLQQQEGEWRQTVSVAAKGFQSKQQRRRGVALACAMLFGALFCEPAVARSLDPNAVNSADFAGGTAKTSAPLIVKLQV